VRPVALLPSSAPAGGSAMKHSAEHHEVVVAALGLG
jgi:hypothetical protein